MALAACHREWKLQRWDGQVKKYPRETKTDLKKRKKSFGLLWFRRLSLRVLLFWLVPKIAGCQILINKSPNCYSRSSCVCFTCTLFRPLLFWAAGWRPTFFSGFVCFWGFFKFLFLKRCVCLFFREKSVLSANSLWRQTPTLIEFFFFFFWKEKEIIDH